MAEQALAWLDIMDYRYGSLLVLGDIRPWIYLAVLKNKDLMRCMGKKQKSKCSDLSKTPSSPNDMAQEPHTSRMDNTSGSPATWTGRLPRCYVNLLLNTFCNIC